MPRSGSQRPRGPQWLALSHDRLLVAGSPASSPSFVAPHFPICKTLGHPQPPCEEAGGLVFPSVRDSSPGVCALRGGIGPLGTPGLV